MVYETRRSRRLRIERQQRRQRRQRVIAFFIAVLSLTGFAAIAIYMGQQDLAAQLNNSGGAIDQDQSALADDDNQSTSQKSVDLGVKITDELPAKLTEINSGLGISEQSGLADLPNSTTTAVTMIDLSDQGNSTVNYNADAQFTSASTYKIYVAYAMIHDVETGRRNWSSLINGTTWETCLSRMIVNSDNTCPEIYLSSIGYSRFNEIVQSLGVSEQTVFEPYDMRTTAADLALVLRKLYQGELMSDENKNKLLDLMRQQVYRQGIPAGIGDNGVVYDKVGFLDSLLHDAGIVHTDHGDYVLVVMTNGESWDYIAQIASYVNGVLAGESQ